MGRLVNKAGTVGASEFMPRFGKPAVQKQLSLQLAQATGSLSSGKVEVHIGK
jgi:hypothetical protein